MNEKLTLNLKQQMDLMAYIRLEYKLSKKSDPDFAIQASSALGFAMNQNHIKRLRAIDAIPPNDRRGGPRNANYEKLEARLADLEALVAEQEAKIRSLQSDLHRGGVRIGLQNTRSTEPFAINHPKS